MADQQSTIEQQLAEKKNLEFRRAMVGKTVNAVTINPPGTAITENYLNVELARPEAPNQMLEVQIGSITEAGLREATAPAALRVLSTS